MVANYYLQFRCCWYSYCMSSPATATSAQCEPRRIYPGPILGHLSSHHNGEPRGVTSSSSQGNVCQDQNTLEEEATGVIERRDCTRFACHALCQAELFCPTGFEEPLNCYMHCLSLTCCTSLVALASTYAHRRYCLGEKHFG